MDWVVLPLVAVTVMLYKAEAVLWMLLPHPASAMPKATNNSIPKHLARLDFLSRHRPVIGNTHTANIPNDLLRRRWLVVAPVWTVMVTLVACAPAAIVLGLKVTVEPVGCPVAEKVTSSPKVERLGVSVKLYAADPPD